MLVNDAAAIADATDATDGPEVTRSGARALQSADVPATPFLSAAFVLFARIFTFRGVL